MNAMECHQKAQYQVVRVSLFEVSMNEAIAADLLCRTNTSDISHEHEHNSKRTLHFHRVLATMNATQRGYLTSTTQRTYLTGPRAMQYACVICTATPSEGLRVEVGRSRVEVGRARVEV